jgi:hypothetical protein
MPDNKKSMQSNTLALDAVRAREIVSVVLDFGVSETQIKKIIKFLSLELLDRDLMTKVSSLVDESFEHVDDIKTKIEI